MAYRVLLCSVLPDTVKYSLSMAILYYDSFQKVNTFFQKNYKIFSFYYIKEKTQKSNSHQEITLIN